MAISALSQAGLIESSLLPLNWKCSGTAECIHTALRPEQDETRDSQMSSLARTARRHCGRKFRACRSTIQ